MLNQDCSLSKLEFVCAYENVIHVTALCGQNVKPVEPGLFTKPTRVCPSENEVHIIAPCGQNWKPVEPGLLMKPATVCLSL